MMTPLTFIQRLFIPMADSAFFSTLSHEGVLAVRGPDASKFLQGKLTCNLNYLSDASASLGARCTPKGRMLSSFRVVSVVDGFLLAMASELVEPQLLDLQKYAVFSKSKLIDESADWVRFGLPEGDAAPPAARPRPPPPAPRRRGGAGRRPAGAAPERRPRRTLGTGQPGRAPAGPVGCTAGARPTESVVAGPGARRHRPGAGRHPRVVHPANAQPAGIGRRQFQEGLLHRPGNRRAHAVPRQAQASPVSPGSGRRAIARTGHRTVLARAI